MIHLLFTSLAIALLILLTACSPGKMPQQPVANSSTPESVPHPSATPSAIAEVPAPLLEQLKQTLSRQTGVPIAQIHLKSATAAEWQDSCLGLASPDELCLMVITPGYRVTLSTPTADYIFHTDRSQAFRLVSQGSLQR
jgi:hypothetical protein